MVFQSATYPWIVKATGIINQWYFYCVDEDFGPFFLKFSSYFPYPGNLCISGNHWAQRQATKAVIGFTAVDNGFAALDDPADLPRLQAICDRLGPKQLERWPVNGSPACRTGSPRATGQAVTGMTSRSCRPSSP